MMESNTTITGCITQQHGQCYCNECRYYPLLANDCDTFRKKYNATTMEVGYQ